MVSKLARFSLRLTRQRYSRLRCGSLGGRAQEQCLDTLSAGIVGPRGRKWRSCKIETPIEASHEVDLFVYLNSGIALPDWFVSGDSLEIDEEETDLADEESCRSDIGECAISSQRNLVS